MKDRDLKSFDKNCKHKLITKTARLLDLDGNVIAKKVKCTKCKGVGCQEVKQQKKPTNPSPAWH